MPAFLTTQSWSKVAPAYLYSFEYAGTTKTRGATFLKGLPLVSTSDRSRNEKLVAHGDELAYLFDARDLFGKPYENGSQVRHLFTLYFPFMAGLKKVPLHFSLAIES